MKEWAGDWEWAKSVASGQGSMCFGEKAGVDGTVGVGECDEGRWWWKQAEKKEARE